MRLYRIAPARFIADLTGEGARLAGGRWNPKGVPALYTAESAALALLEYLARVTLADLPADLSMAVLEVTEPCALLTITSAELPSGWDTPSIAPATIELGRQWLETVPSPALRVPSVMLPPGLGWNIILNPRHPALNLALIEVLPLQIDHRLL
jgi:RES domain-containing protein